MLFLGTQHAVVYDGNFWEMRETCSHHETSLFKMSSIFNRAV